MSRLLQQAREIAELTARKNEGIDIIYAYGGVAQGREHSRSDIEMVAVADSVAVRWEFVLNDRPVFVWPYNWNTLESIAHGNNGEWSVAASSIVNAKVLWSRSIAIEEKFRRLQATAVKGSVTALKRRICGFDLLFGKLWRIQEAIKEEKKVEITFILWDIINTICDTLAALNGRLYLNNWGKLVHEIKDFDKKPVNFIARYNNLLEARPEESLKIATSLVNDVRDLMKEWILENEVDLNEDLREITLDWPTVLEYLNKAAIASETGNLPAGLFAAYDNAEFNLWAFTALRGIKWDKNCFFSASESIKKLPKKTRDNLKVLLESKNLQDIQMATKELAEILERELIEKDLKLPLCSSLEEALEFLEIN